MTPDEQHLREVVLAEQSEFLAGLMLSQCVAVGSGEPLERNNAVWRQAAELIRSSAGDNYIHSPARAQGVTEEQIEAAAQAIYEADPYYESGEYVEGHPVSPGGYLSWRQAKARDAEFGDDKLLGKLTEIPYKAARAVLALSPVPTPTTTERQE